MKDYYQILHLKRSAKPEEIREQYRVLVLAWHPDKFSESAEKARAEEVTKDLNAAYEVLKDPEKRARYDRERFPAQPPAQRPISERRASQRPASPWRTSEWRTSEWRTSEWRTSEPPTSERRDSGQSAPPRGAWTEPAGGSRPDALHYQFDAEAADSLHVELDQPAHVMLLDSINYHRYRSGGKYRAYGGYTQAYAFQLQVPYPGLWHLLISSQNPLQSVRASTRLYKAGW